MLDPSKRTNSFSNSFVLVCMCSSPRHVTQAGNSSSAVRRPRSLMKSRLLENETQQRLRSDEGLTLETSAF